MKNIDKKLIIFALSLGYVYTGNLQNTVDEFSIRIQGIAKDYDMNVIFEAFERVLSSCHKRFFNDEKGLYNTEYVEKIIEDVIDMYFVEPLDYKVNNNMDRKIR